MHSRTASRPRPRSRRLFTEHLEARNLLTGATELCFETEFLEAEQATGDGSLRWRSEASEVRTIWLGDQQSRNFTLDLAEDNWANVAVRLSNDNYGPTETIELFANGQKVGEASAPDTGNYGAGWNQFVTVDLGRTRLPAGLNSVELRVSGGDGYGVEIDGLSVERIPIPEQTGAESVTIEAEAGAGDGALRWRSNASGARTVWLHDGQARTVTHTVSQRSEVDIQLRVSNDNWGPTETLIVSVDGNQVAQVTAPDTGNGGAGWNVFETVPVGKVLLDAGEHAIEVRVAGGDGYGVELDAVQLEQVAQPFTVELWQQRAGDFNNSTTTADELGAPLEGTAVYGISQTSGERYLWMYWPGVSGTTHVCDAAAHRQTNTVAVDAFEFLDATDDHGVTHFEVVVGNSVDDAGLLEVGFRLNEEGGFVDMDESIPPQCPDNPPLPQRQFERAVDLFFTVLGS